MSFSEKDHAGRAVKVDRALTDVIEAIACGVSEDGASRSNLVGVLRALPHDVCAHSIIALSTLLYLCDRGGITADEIRGSDPYRFGEVIAQRLAKPQ